MTIREYYKSIDVSFGSNEHQRKFVDRMERLQEECPCELNHDNDVPPVHVSRCYPQSAVDRALARQT